MPRVRRIFFMRGLGEWRHRNAFCYRLKKTDCCLSSFEREDGVQVFGAVVAILECAFRQFSMTAEVQLIVDRVFLLFVESLGLCNAYCLSTTLAEAFPLILCPH